jgi:DNA modification methylase
MVIYDLFRMTKTTVETLFADPTHIPEPDEKFVSIVTRPLPPQKIVTPDGMQEPPNLYRYFKFMEQCAEEWFRLLSNEGLLWLNIADITTQSVAVPNRYRYRNVAQASKYHKPPIQWANLPHKVLDIFTSCGWLYRSCVVWDRMETPKALNKSGNIIQPKHEYLFMLAKDRSHRFFLDRLADKSSVWSVPVSTGHHHKDTFPIEIPRRCIPLSAQRYEWVLDPCSNTDGTTGKAAKQMGCNAVNYVSIAKDLERSA